MKTLRDIPIDDFDIGCMAYAISDTSEIFDDMPWVEAGGSKAETIYFRGSVRLEKSLIALGRIRVINPKWNDAIADVASEFVRQLFYGNGVGAMHQVTGQYLEFTGLSSFYNTADPNEAQNAVNVIDASRGGPSRSSWKTFSIWLVGWSPAAIYIAYPKGSDTAGLVGEGLYAGLTAALVPIDWRYAVRIANLDESSDLAAYMAKAMLRLPNLRSGAEQTPAFYMGPTARKLFGEAVFRDIPVRCIPQLRDDEERVV